MTLQTEPAVPARTSATLSYEQFLEVMDGEHVEWVRGEIIKMAPVSDEHQDLGLFLLAVLRPFVEFHDLGQLFSAATCFRGFGSRPTGCGRRHCLARLTS
jgi:Uma2 family endonuclease